MSVREFGVVLGHGNQLLVVFVKYANLVFGKVLDIDQSVTGSLHGDDNLIELQMYRQRILVLRSLNQKHHQKGDNGRARVYHQLPGV